MSIKIILQQHIFGTDIRLLEILKTPEFINVEDRFDYVILGAIGLVTGQEQTHYNCWNVCIINSF